MFSIETDLLTVNHHYRDKGVYLYIMVSSYFFSSSIAHLYPQDQALFVNVKFKRPKALNSYKEKIPFICQTTWS